MSERGINSAKLAEKVGMSKVAVSNIVTGKSSPSIDNLKKIAQVLGVSIAKLVGEERTNCNFYPSDYDGKYKCCFVLTSNVHNMNWNSSYIYNINIQPMVGDTLDFSAISDCEDSVFQEFGTKYFIVDKRILFPLAYCESEFDMIIFMSPYKLTK
jgi:Predicted transcriptional regulators